MRVLHVAECTGGVDRYLRCLLKYSNCENIMILSQLFNKQDFSRISDSVEIVPMEHRICLAAIKEAYEIRKKIYKYTPDVVYAHSSIAGAITRMACIGLNTKVIYNPHGWSFNMEGKKQKIYIMLEKLMAYFCDAIICISEAEKLSALKENICSEEKLHVIYNGIDFKEYNGKIERLSIPDDAFVVGMVGRICRQKAPDIFIKMAGKVQKQISNAYFVIVGDTLAGTNDERKKIEDLAKSLGVRLLITGWVNNPLSYMKRFDVACLFSRWEGFGLVIPEYMYAGIPVVATNVDAIPYLINDGKTGLLVEKNDWNEAANKVIMLFDDTKLRADIAKEAKLDVLRRFDARRVSKECEELYKELTK